MRRRGPGKVVVDCSYCRGSGAIGVGTCPACNGRARFSYQLRRGEEVMDCGRCGGNGAVGGGLCPLCNGSGWDVI